jgi:hypothetical protein
MSVIHQWHVTESDGLATMTSRLAISNYSSINSQLTDYFFTEAALSWFAG